MPNRQRLSKLLSSRWRHMILLLPMGAVIGIATGVLFRDIGFGFAVGCLMGALFGVLFAVRNPAL